MALRVLAALIFAITTAVVFQNCDGFKAGQISASGSSSVANNQAIGFAATDAGYDIILIAGQSNAVGYGCGAHTDISNAQDGRIFQVTPDNQVVPMTDPLDFQPNAGNLVGFGVTFARLYAQNLSPKRKVIVVPAAMLGSSVLRWDKLNEGIQFATVADSTQLWDQMFQRTQTALAYGGSANRVVAILWHQGEADYTNIVATDNIAHPWMSAVPVYQSRFLTLLQDFRSAYSNGSPLPIVTGHIGSFWVQPSDAGGATFTSFNQTIDSVAARLGNAASVSTEDLPSDAMDGCSTDPQHFSASSQVEIGKRYFAKFLALTPAPSLALQNFGALPQAFCDISGGALGTELYAQTSDHASCASQCAAQTSVHPALFCLWQGSNLAQTDHCQIVGGALGTRLVDATNSRGECTNLCNSLLPVHPAESCTWGSTVLQSPPPVAASACGGTMAAGTVVQSGIYSPPGGNSCGQTSGTANQCLSCSARWNCPNAATGCLCTCD